MHVIQSKKLLFTSLLGLVLLQPTLTYADNAKELNQDNKSIQLNGDLDPIGEPITASNLLGKSVKSKDGRDIGKVDELVINRAGLITHITLSNGGLMGVGSNLTPVPWEAFELKRDFIVEPTDYPLTLDVTEKMIQGAPRIKEYRFSLLSPNYSALDESNIYFKKHMTAMHQQSKNTAQQSSKKLEKISEKSKEMDDETDKQ